MTKTYVICEFRYRVNGVVEKRYTGTIDELLEIFGYTLQCGKDYEHERGNRKINTNPKTGKSLCTALNNAAHNISRNGLTEREYILDERG